MTERAELLTECRIFSRYLVDTDPGNYVCDSYVAAVRQLRESLSPTSSFDRLLLRLARLHPLITRSVDVYARFFAPASSIRRRLITLLAIIESDGTMLDRLERPDQAGLPGFIGGMLWRSLLLVVLLSIAMLILLPVQLVTGRPARGRPQA
ncbi:MAG: hypothetical protein OEY45_02730 [Gammaproteobacteria bacterium]|nr:hypothetical protein [Gammaproteobacteria bacterium]